MRFIHHKNYFGQFLRAHLLIWETDNDTGYDRQETESNSPETSTTFHSENPCEHCENSNVYGTLIMKCPKCFWHDYYKICPICDHQIPEERKRAFFGVTIVEQFYTQKGEGVGNQILFLFKEDNEEED